MLPQFTEIYKIHKSIYYFDFFGYTKGEIYMLSRIYNRKESDMKKVKLPRLLEGLPLATLGALIFAVAVAFFYDPSRLAPGGISGIAVIISHITSVPTGTLIFAMNIPLLILAWRRFGRRFVFLTVYATALSSLAMDLLAPFAAQAAPLTDDLTVIALCGAALDGLGLGLVFRAGGCTGGSDIIVKFLRQKYRYIRTGGMSLILNSAVVVATFFAFGNLEITIYSALAMLTASFVLDKVLYSGDSAKLVFVISDKSQEITSEILSAMQIGVTLLSGEGAYTGQPKKVILCVAKKHTFPKLRDVVKKLDPNAFVIVSSATEIFGEGYKSQYTDEI